MDRRMLRLAVAGLVTLVTACAGPAPRKLPTIASRPNAPGGGTTKATLPAATQGTRPNQRGDFGCEEDTLVLYAPIQFPEGSAEPMEEASPLIDVFACKLRVRPEIRCRLVAVVGHADSTEEHGDKLARARAERVVSEFIRRGLAPECLRAESAGAREPATDGHSNRRVTLRFVDE